MSSHLPNPVRSPQPSLGVVYTSLLFLVFFSSVSVSGKPVHELSTIGEGCYPDIIEPNSQAVGLVPRETLSRGSMILYFGSLSVLAPLTANVCGAAGAAPPVAFACVGLAAATAITAMAGAWRGIINRKRGVIGFVDSFGTQFNIDMDIIHEHNLRQKRSDDGDIMTLVGTAVNNHRNMFLHYRTSSTGYTSMGAYPRDITGSSSDSAKRGEQEDQESNIYVDYNWRPEDESMEYDLGQYHQDDMSSSINDVYASGNYYNQGTWGAQFGEDGARAECGFFAQSENNPWFFHGDEVQADYVKFCG